ncbi:MAG TPA: hypothetical protein VGF94_08440 [Kofleriaceae bacterium]
MVMIIHEAPLKLEILRARVLQVLDEEQTRTGRHRSDFAIVCGADVWRWLETEWNESAALIRTTRIPCRKFGVTFRGCVEHEPDPRVCEAAPKLDDLELGDRLRLIKQCTDEAIARVGEHFDRTYGELIEKLSRENDRLNKYGRAITHAVVGWPAGDWSAGKIFFEGTHRECRRHWRWMASHLDKVIEHAGEEFRGALFWIRHVELVPTKTLELDELEPEPTNGVRMNPEEWSAELREKQAETRRKEREQVVLDVDWD